MYYSKKEEYSFKIPSEHTAYLKFKQNLKDSGIRFVEEGGHTHQTIIIRTNGVFYMDENGDIQMKLTKKKRSNQMTTIFMYVAALVLGFVLALLIISLKEKPDGYIVINETDPDKDVYTLELGISFGELNEKKKVIFYTRKVS